LTTNPDAGEENTGDHPNSAAKKTVQMQLNLVSFTQLNKILDWRRKYVETDDTQSGEEEKSRQTRTSTHSRRKRKT